CGAVAASLLVIGHLFGRDNKYGNDITARTLTKEFTDKFKAVHKATCCRVLSKGFELHSPERKIHCCNFVEFCSKLLDETVNIKIKNG
ncbi:MAG: C-GCAxxG-C-C family protein, partial [Candidatus Gastranaerophilales bacterium]|nr:C-GCAxxG-C-C family protein [Candidatus Gastranaerophilales bacterium]